VSTPLVPEDGLFDFRRTRSFTTEYVATFYGDHPPTEDERAVLAFLTTHAGRITGRPRMLEVGCGPTIHHVFPFVPYVSAVDMADYLPENLAAVRRWQTRAPGAYSWRQYARLAVELQARQATDEEVDRLEANARACIGRLRPCDLKQPAVLEGRETYPVVGAFYCTEEVGISIPRWESVMENLGRTVSPGGMLFLSCLQDTDFYMVGETRYPCARITETNVRHALSSLGFDMEASAIESVTLESQRDAGLVGVVLAAARKRLSA
jgi:NNMT/PNMT/TEMT family